jgi:hypothetical protein
LLASALQKRSAVAHFVADCDFVQTILPAHAILVLVCLRNLAEFFGCLGCMDTASLVVIILLAHSGSVWRLSTEFHRPSG